MQIRFFARLAALCALAAPACADPASIGFEGPPDGPAPADMSEDGYTVTTLNMAISSSAKSGDGTDGPNEIESLMNAPGQIIIARHGAPFRFVSLDWQAEDGTATVHLRGYQDGAEVARDSFTTQGPGGFVRFDAQKLSGATLDRLVITPQRNRLGHGALDRIILDAPAAALQSLGVAPNRPTRS